MVTRIRHFFRGILMRRRVEREMREEMAQHLERATERLIARGMPPGEARLVARREFGNVTLVQEAGRRARGGQWLETVAGDIRFALRQFARTPLTSATMIVVLSLGIAANVALFGVLHSLTRRPAAGIPDDDALVRIQAWYRGSAGGRRVERGLSHAELQDYIAQPQLFAGVAAWSQSSTTLGLGSGDEGVTSGMVHWVTGNYFDVLGVRLAIGAGLPRTPPDSLSPDLVAVISYALWERAFRRAPDVLGKAITVNDIPVTVAGVAPPRFLGVNQSTNDRTLWLPLGARTAVLGGGSLPLMRADSASLYAIARLAPGIDADRTQGVVRAIAARYPWNYHPALRTPREYSTSVASLSAYAEPDFETEGVVASMVFAGIGLLILAVTCATVSTLLVGHAVARRREIAVRVSLGASRGRILRQLLTESVMLAVAAALAGLGILWIIGRSLQAGIRDLDLAIHWEAVAFAIGFGVATVILFGLSPALHASRASVADALKDSTAAIVSSRSRVQKSLVVAQIALSQPLLLGLVALVTLILREGRTSAGRTARDRIVVVNFNRFVTGGTRSEAGEALGNLRTRVAHLPGVERVVPFTGAVQISDYAVHPADRLGGERDTSFRGRSQEVHPDFFAVLDIPVVRGRGFDPDDVGASPPPVIVGSDLAQELWGTENPVGRRFVQSRGESRSERIVIGVVDAERAGPSEQYGSQRFFVPLDERIRGNLISTLYVRTRAPAEPLIPTIRALARAEAPRVPIVQIETLASRDARSRAGRLRMSSVAAAGGLLALLLSSIGLYAVVAFAVAQRTREIGIRIALGARQLQVVSVFFRSGMRLSVVGLALGLPIGFVAVRYLMELIEMPTAYLPFVAVGVAALVVAVASLATWIPARRASRVDPLIALRTE